MKDRVPTYPGRVKLTPVSGQENTYDMERADEPTQEGTPLNKSTFLKDTTAAKLGLEQEDPTVDDAFSGVKDALDNVFKIGDLKSSVRTDLGDKWLLCNGDFISDTDYPELRELAMGSLDWKYYLKSPYGTYLGRTFVTPLYKDYHFLLYGYGQSAATPIVLNIETMEKTNVSHPSGYTMDSFIGLDWDGDRWVCCYRKSTTQIEFYASDNLTDWTLVYTYTNPTTSYSLYSTVDVYCTPTCLFDGVSFRVALSTTSAYIVLVFTISKDFSTSQTPIVATSKGEAYTDRVGVHCADGLVLVNAYNYFWIYALGSADAVFSSSNSSTARWDSSCFYKYAANKYMLMPINNPGGCYLSNYVAVFDSSTKAFTTKYVSQIVRNDTVTGIDGYTIRSVRIDRETNEFVFVFKDASLSSNIKYCTYRLTIGDDITVNSNYRLEDKSSDEPFYVSTSSNSYESGIDKYGNYMFYNISNGGYDYAYYLTGPDVKAVPNVSLDGAYAYIKAK